ncbi:MAG: hypothetical protein AB1817_21805 [Chloroflexota bacterium]
MFKRTQVLLVIGVLVLLILVGVGGFMAGRNAGLTEQVNIRNEFFQQRAATTGGAPGTGSGFGSVPSAPGTGGSDTAQTARGVQGRALANGTVKSVQGNTITVTQQRDGSTATITVDDKTIIEKMTTGTLADIQPGWRISVTEQQTGTTTIRRIVLTQGQ